MDVLAIIGRGLLIVVSMPAIAFYSFVRSVFGHNVALAATSSVITAFAIVVIPRIVRRLSARRARQGQKAPLSA